MANIKSAKKRAVLDRERGATNRKVRSRIRTAVKRVREADEPETAQARLREAVSLLDRAARRRIMHPNRVARTKSQLDAHVSSLGDG